MTITRRTAAIGAGLAALAALAAGGIGHLLGRWYPPTPYDDLLHQIVDREPAAALGRAALVSMPATLPALAAQLLGEQAPALLVPPVPVLDLGESPQFGCFHGANFYHVDGHATC